MRTWSPNSRTIEALREFVAALLWDPMFDYVVPIERKGTALIRAAIMGSESPNWGKVLAREAACVTLANRPGVRVLALDDSVWSGETIKATVGMLEAALPRAEVVTAAFMTHADAPSGSVDISYFQGLGDNAFRERRAAVVEYLQQQGSLLLDTEHAEVAVRLSCSSDEFFRALAGWGKAVKFSPPYRLNCTVFQHASELLEQLRGVLPSYADISDAVCKVRVVERPQISGGFSLIPICYPNVWLDRASGYDHPRMEWTKRVTGDRLFNCIGLCVAIEMLVHLMQWLDDCLGGKVSFEYGPAQLRHLNAAFPELDVDEVIAELGRSRESRRVRATHLGVPDEPGLQILEKYAEKIKRRCYDPGAYRSGTVRNLRLPEILAVAQSEVEVPRVSAALDLLIDKAVILPRVSKLKTAKGVMAFREFGPDGEMVRRELIREALLTGRGVEVDADICS